MNIENMRGMRDVPTMQGSRKRSLSVTREHAVTELARLEHEKARLERELGIWQANAKKTSRRLARIDEQLSVLQHILTPAPAKEEGPVERRKTHPSPDEDATRTDQAWQEIKLEY
jgi:hypothetical protein